MQFWKHRLIQMRLGAIILFFFALTPFAFPMPYRLVFAITFFILVVPMAVLYWREGNRLARVIKASSAKAKRFSDEDYTTFEEQEILAKRLARLEDAHDQGLINDEEYVQTRQKILEEA